MTSPHPGLQRLLDEAPYVRLLARQLLAEEADDVVQQTWLQAIQHGGDHVESPRAWLAQIVRNLATSVHRGRARQRRQQHSGGEDHLVSSSAELMQQEEQRRMLVAAVDRLPKQLRTVVLLRYFEGLTPRAIAHRLNAPTTTVWNQLRRALQLLRERLDAEHGGQRRAWLLPLVPFAAGTHRLPWLALALPTSVASAASWMGLGVLTMTMNTKLVAAMALVLGLTGAFAWWATRDPVPLSPDMGGNAAQRAAVATSILPRDTVTADAGAPNQRQPVDVPSAAATSSTGTLVVHVRYGDDKAPAQGVTMLVRRAGSDQRVEGLRQRTDAAGSVRFEALPAGRHAVACDRSPLGKRAEIRAGEITELEYDLEIGLHVTGIVVDAAGTAVVNALIEVAPLAAEFDAEALTTSGDDGRFSVRGAPTATLVGARAEGHSASPMQFLLGQDGNEAEVRLQLGPPAGGVDGLVVDEHGEPIANAVVRIGSGQTSGIASRNNGAPALPALVRSDAQGRFRAIGVPPGKQPVVARAIGCAPWQGTCEVVAHAVAQLRIDLRAGASIRGMVHNAAGAPTAKVTVEVGQGDDFAHFRTLTAADGHFELTGLPVGEVALVAQHDEFGKAEHRVRTAAGTTSACELLLSRGLELRGRVVDASGAALAGAGVHVDAARPDLHWHGSAGTDHEGRFAVANCPEGVLLHVAVRKRGFAELRRANVDPLLGEVELTLRPASVRIRGIVTAPNGEPVANSIVSPVVASAAAGVWPMHATGPDGRFELGPMAPGSWQVVVRSAGFPPFASEARELASDAVWDLGKIQLVAGGDAVVRVEGDRTGITFSIVDAERRSVSKLLEEDDALRSEQLLPGDHLLLVAGATAAQAIPFVVSAGQTTRLTVRPVPGVRQRLELEPTALAPLSAGVAVRIHRGSELLHQTWISLQAGQSASSEICLSPGDYGVAIADGDRQLASASFSVGTTEGPPLRLELR